MTTFLLIYGLFIVINAFIVYGLSLAEMKEKKETWEQITYNQLLGNLFLLALIAPIGFCLLIWYTLITYGDKPIMKKKDDNV